MHACTTATIRLVCICSCTYDINERKKDWISWCDYDVNEAKHERNIHDVLTTSMRENATEITSHAKSRVMLQVLWPRGRCGMWVIVSIVVIVKQSLSFAWTAWNYMPVLASRFHVLFSALRRVASRFFFFLHSSDADDAYDHGGVGSKTKRVYIQC